MKVFCILCMLAVCASMVAGCDQHRGFNGDKEVEATKFKYVEMNGKLACGLALNADMERMSLSCDVIPQRAIPAASIQTPSIQIP